MFFVCKSKIQNDDRSNQKLGNGIRIFVAGGLRKYRHFMGVIKLGMVFPRISRIPTFFPQRKTPTKIRRNPQVVRSFQIGLAGQVSSTLS